MAEKICWPCAQRDKILHTPPYKGQSFLDWQHWFIHYENSRCVGVASKLLPVPPRPRGPPWASEGLKDSSHRSAEVLPSVLWRVVRVEHRCCLGDDNGRCKVSVKAAVIWASSATSATVTREGGDMHDDTPCCMAAGYSPEGRSNYHTITVRWGGHDCQWDMYMHWVCDWLWARAIVWVSE